MLHFVYISQGFPNGVHLKRGQFGQNGQKLHENYKIKLIFWVVEGSSQFPPLGETLACKLHEYIFPFSYHIFITRLLVARDTNLKKDLLQSSIKYLI